MTTFTKTEQAKAAWAAKVFQESGRTQTTARAMHYFCLGRADYPLFDRTGKQNGARLYKDSDDDNLTEWIALAKRQGMIDWDALPDDTVGEYGVQEFYPNRSDFSYSYSNSSFNGYDTGSLKHILRRKTFDWDLAGVHRDQPFHLELWVEKSTMNNILKPVCDRFGAVLVTFKGHCSWGAVRKLCKRVAQDGRPTLVFYLSDMDASGFRMAVEMTEKIDELNSNFFKGRLNVRVRRIGLTPKQVKDLDIPLVPRKETETSNKDLYKAYVASYGLDPDKKAELDALEKFYTGGVAAFASSWLEKFFDSTLQDRCQNATSALLHAMPYPPELPPEVIELKSKILLGLEELIEAEEELVVPDGGYTDPDIDPITESPNDTAWLLDTKHGVRPRLDDVDFTEGPQP